MERRIPLQISDKAKNVGGRMGETSKSDLERIRHELASVYHDAAWKVVSLIIQASAVRDGLDRPLTPEEWERINLLINRLNSTARDAEKVLKYLDKPRWGQKMFPDDTNGENSSP